MDLLRELFVLTEGKKDDKIVVPSTKPRAKAVNDTLRSKKGARHYNAKTDYVRAKEKSKASQMMEAEECCYFWYDVRWEEKNHSGTGPEETSNHDHGVIEAPSRTQAILKVKNMLSKRAYNAQVRVGKASKADYDEYMKD